MINMGLLLLSKPPWPNRLLSCLVLLLVLSASPASIAEVIKVDDAQDLRQALRSAEPGDIIDIMPGDYFLPSLTLRQQGREASPIVVQAAITGTVTVWTSHAELFKLYGAHWHFKGLDFQGSHSADHALHIVENADGIVIEGNRFQNFHAAIKANGEGAPREFPDNVRIRRNIFVNDTPRDTRAPVVPIDVVGGRDWEIAENFIADIAHAPHQRGRNTSAAFVKGGAHGTVFDRNLVICEWRHRGGQRVGLTLGGKTSPSVFDQRTLERCTDNCPESRTGRMTNNIILNCPEEPGIYLNKARDALIANNTIFNAFGIQARFPETRVEVVDNLLTGTVWARHDGHVQDSTNLETGWFDSANYLPALKKRLVLPVPDHRIIYTEWLDWLIRWLVDTVNSWLDWLADSFLGKGLDRFENWFVAPRFGDLRLDDSSEIVGRGSSTPRVAHDFCGQPRSAPSDIGAIEYKAGRCDLMDELERRHGPFLVSLMQPRTAAPQSVSDWVTPDPRTTLPEPLRVLHANPGNYRRTVADLEPGDWLQLAPGEYPRPLSLHHIRGTAEHPIVISGPAQGEPAVFLGRSGVNTISLIDAAHIIIRHLSLDGRKQNVAGVVAEGHGRYAHDITVEHLRIRNYDGAQANSGITTRVPAWNWIIRHNDIRDVGTGMYLGSSDGTAPFIGGLIENNFIADTLGYNLQIKQQNARDRLPGMPTEPRQTIIRYNVFSKAARADSGSRARPNLLVGHWPPSGPGMHDRYLIYANLFHENPHERLFQGEGNVALYNNLFVNKNGDGLIVMRHNHVPKDVHILHNTIVATGFGIRIDHTDRDYRQVVAGNAVFADEPLVLPRSVEEHDNHTADRAAAEALLSNPNADLPDMDFYPRGESLQTARHIDAIDLPKLDRDYNGRPRQRPFRGAYAGGEPVNPGRQGDIGPVVPGCGPCR